MDSTTSLSHGFDGSLSRDDDNSNSRKGESGEDCQCDECDENENTNNNEWDSEEDDHFAEIPELPAGEVLRLELLSSWDDPNFVGLGRIELFNDQGIQPAVKEIWTNAVESNGDLRGLVRYVKCANNGSNDDVNPDESQMWFCNYRQLLPDSMDPPYIHISIRFECVQTLAMIRIWNYIGSSRVHAIRGVRNMRIWLDQKCIFKGEICCCSGAATYLSADDDSPKGDTILFTTNEDILTRIAEHDEQMRAAPPIKIEQQNVLNTATMLMPDEQQKQQTTNAPCLSAPNRPITGYTSSGNSSSSSTSATSMLREQQKKEHDIMVEDHTPTDVDEQISGEEENDGGEDEENICVGKVFHIELLANWGCADAIGLTGIQFLGPKFQPLPDTLIKQCIVRSEPSLTSERDDCRLMNLLNGHNLTCNLNDMWLMMSNEIAAGKDLLTRVFPVLSFTFPCDIRVSGISLWNYNASPELSYAGVRSACFYANGRPINGMNSVLLRKAPGFVFFDFVQDILFDRCPLFRPLSNYRPQTRSVAAFIFQIRLLTSWGDEYYIGLNGIELFNRHDQRIQLRPQNLAAFPESVNCLANICGTDPRTSDKLIDNVNDTTKAHHMWLTPILPNSCARVFVIFDAPTLVTRIRIYNYRKTPERGVRHIALSADDLLLCSGAEVPMSSARETGILDIPLRDNE